MKPPEVIQATSESTSKYIAQSVEDIKASKAKREADDRMRAGLLSEPNTDRATPDEANWRNCQQSVAQDFHQKRMEFMRSLFCNAKYEACLNRLICSEEESAKAILAGIHRALALQVATSPKLRDASAQLVRGLLGEDGKPCPSSQYLDAAAKEGLRAAISPGGALYDAAKRQTKVPLRSRR